MGLSFTVRCNLVGGMRNAITWAFWSFCVWSKIVNNYCWRFAALYSRMPHRGRDIWRRISRNSRLKDKQEKFHKVCVLVIVQPRNESQSALPFPLYIVKHISIHPIVCLLICTPWKCASIKLLFVLELWESLFMEWSNNCCRFFFFFFFSSIALSLKLINIYIKPQVCKSHNISDAMSSCLLTPVRHFSHTYIKFDILM